MGGVGTTVVARGVRHLRKRRYHVRQGRRAGRGGRVVGRYLVVVVVVVVIVASYDE